MTEIHCSQCGHDSFVCSCTSTKCRKPQENKKGFTLHFDEAPAFVFVSEDGQNAERIFVNGKEVHGWQSLEVHSAVDEITTYEIKFVTYAQKQM